MTALEEELSVKTGTLKSIQSEMVQSKKELGARELSLQKVSNELSLAHARTAQESERVKTPTITADSTGDATTENQCFSYHSSCSVFSKMGGCLIWQNIFLLCS